MHTLKKKIHPVAAIALVLLLLIIQNACTKQVFEPDISNKTIEVLAPANNLSTSTSSITFWWTKIEEENISYRIQIVDSSFSGILQIITDTSTTADKFSVSLAPGKYQWRIQAYNSGTKTAYQTYNLTILSSPDLSSQIVILNSPANGFLSNAATHIFSWDTLSNADGYRFQVLNSASALITDLYLQTDSFQQTLSDGTYTWQVRAENAFSNSVYSSRSITIDLTAPATPVPLTPVSGSTQANPVSLSWTRDASASGDSLFICTDSLMTNPAISPFFTSNSSYNFTGVSTQKYFWKLKSRDAAGNWSGYSTTYKFIVQ